MNPDIYYQPTPSDPWLPKPGTRWKHFKGPTYTVVGRARHSETWKWLILYIEDGHVGDPHARPEETWDNIIRYENNVALRRFTFIDD